MACSPIIEGSKDNVVATIIEPRQNFFHPSMLAEKVVTLTGDRKEKVVFLPGFEPSPLTTTFCPSSQIT